MTPRVRMLTFGLLGTVFIWQFWPMVQSTVFGPLEALQARVTQLDGEIEKKQATQRQVLQAQKKLKAWTSRSLPPDRLSAATLYQNWLIELAQQHKLATVKV